jgi:hypothetical protein
MTPLFGGGEDKQANEAAFHREVDRVNALPLAQLAAEVMRKAFTGADGFITLGQAAGAFIPDGHEKGIDDADVQRIYEIVAEGIQVLEHACLVRMVFHGNDRSTANYHWDVTATRLGKNALAQNDVERYLGGT